MNSKDAFAGTTQSSPAVEKVVNDILGLIKATVMESVREALAENNDPLASTPHYYSRKEVAEKLGVSLTTLWRIQKLNPGVFKSTRIGKKVVFAAEDVDAAMERMQDFKIS